jgi:hypothetical protein
MSAENQGGYDRHVEKVEKGILETDGLMEARIEQLQFI